MAYEYINRKEEKYFLHHKKTNTGKIKYYFSKKEADNTLDIIPTGYEVYENPGAQVFLRKIQPKIIYENEIKTVEKGIKEFTKYEDFIVDIKKNMIIIHTPNQKPSFLSGILEDSLHFQLTGKKTMYKKYLRFIAVLRFILVDKEKRIFRAERFNFRGSIDDWRPIHEIKAQDNLENLVKRYCTHLDKDSFYELY